jgi:hypothetical protein
VPSCETTEAHRDVRQKLFDEYLNSLIPTCKDQNEVDELRSLWYDITTTFLSDMYDGTKTLNDDQTADRIVTEWKSINSRIAELETILGIKRSA